jgi:hypothetical protein
MGLCIGEFAIVIEGISWAAAAWDVYVCEREALRWAALGKCSFTNQCQWASDVGGSCVRPILSAASLLFIAAILACPSPWAPLPTSPNTAIAGTVVELRDGPPYTFLLIETDKGRIWVAVPAADVPKKSRVTVRSRAVLKDFESKQARTRFEAVVFGVMENG